MSQAGGEPDLAALRERIRRAARTTRMLRLGVSVLAIPVAWRALATPTCFWTAVRWYDRMSLDLYVDWLLPAALLVGILSGLLCAARYRQLRRTQLRHALAALSPAQRAEVLLPLQSKRGDTRKIVAPLLREFGLPTELTPATSPEGRGDEVTPPGR